MIYLVPFKRRMPLSRARLSFADQLSSSTSEMTSQISLIERERDGFKERIQELTEEGLSPEEIIMRGFSFEKVNEALKNGS